MTAAVKEEPSKAKRQVRRGVGARGGGGGGAQGHPWKKLWQVPLFLAGLAAFGLGVRSLVRTIRPVPFADQVKGLQLLLDNQKYAQAIEHINVLGDYYKLAEQQGLLQELAGDAHYLAQRQMPAVVRENYERVEDHYRKAVAWGLLPSVQMNERWGEAALALGDAPVAVEKLEAALMAAGPQREDLVKRHGRDLVAAYSDDRKFDKALDMLEQMLKAGAAAKPDDLEAIETRTWVLCRRIEIALDSGDPASLEKATKGARAALLEFKERDPAGRILVWLGRAELERSDAEGAARDLKDARKHFAVHHLDDGRAAVMLGYIAKARGDLDAASVLFQEVAVSHAGTTIWAAARLGRAETALLKGQPVGEQVLADYELAINAVKTDGEKPPVGRAPEMINLEGVRVSLVKSYQRASEAGRLEEALAFLALQGKLGDRESAETAYRLAFTHERRGEEILQEASKLEGAAQVKRQMLGRSYFARAADDYQRHARLTTLNDEQSGSSSWKAAQLLDRAGESQAATSLYERLTIQRPRDPHVSDGLLALGRLYESAGHVTQALEVYERNIRANARTPAAYESAVSLARCYMEAGEKAGKPEEKKADLDKAEAALLALVQDNSDLDPTAREFRDSLIMLGEIYYRDRRWSDAILRLDEVAQRYPSDPGYPRALFMLAEAHRRSAMDISEALKDPATGSRGELETSRAARLLKAAEGFTRVIGLLDAQAQGGGGGGGGGAVEVAAGRSMSLLEEEYLRTSYMDRAECYFERGEYETAIKLYDQAAARFSEETTAVQAYVQIVNAYLALKQPTQARAAAERGRWILERVPDAALGANVSGADRRHYERLLTLDEAKMSGI